VIQFDGSPLTEDFCVEPGGLEHITYEECIFPDPIDYTDADNLVEFIGSDKACFEANAEVSVNTIGTSTNHSEVYKAQMMQTITVTYEYQPPLCISGYKFQRLNR
jgi:hypothetical protein